MLNHPPYNHDIIRKITVLVGTLFNDISLTRDAGTGTAQTIKVPISYGPKEKFLARVNQNPDLTNEVAITLPRMSFEINGLQYAPERQKNKIKKLISGSDYVFNPVPYDIAFTLYVMVKNTVDGTRIIEQILPYFSPQISIPATLIDIAGVDDINIILNGVQIQDSWEGDFETRRAQIYILNFTAKAYFYGPTTQNGALIKFADSRIFSLYTNTQIQSITAQPGLTANGEPTTDISETIAYTDIEPTDNYGFIIDFDGDLTA